MSSLHGKIFIVINEIFPNLISNEKTILLDMLIELLKLIISRFSYNEEDIISQLTLNNYKDIRTLINILIPYINDDNGTYTLHKQIKSLSDISSLKNDKEYIISNIKYNFMDDTTNLSIDIIKKNAENLKKVVITVANKLYVNWINCLPISLDEYKKENLYINSYKYKNKKFIQNEKIMSKDDIYDINYKGIHIFDIYNSIINYFFYDLLQCKWLLYEKIINNKPRLYLEELLDYFPTLHNTYTWNLLLDSDKSIILGSWTKLLKSTTPISYSLLKNIILHYENYTNNNKIFTKVDIEYIKEDDKEFKFKDNQYDNKFINLINKYHNIQDIYNYIVAIYNYFRTKTWYGHRIIKNKKINNIIHKDYKDYTINRKRVFYSYKNIYNWAKFLYLKYKKNESEEIDEDNKNKVENEARNVEKFDILIDYLNDDNNGFSIKNNIILIYGDQYKDISEEISKNIDKFIKENLINYVFESYIYAGVLSKFKPEVVLSDNKNEKNFNKNIKIINFTKPKISNYKLSYYFLTGEQYGRLNMYDNEYEIPYIDTLYLGSQGRKWYNNYSLDWMFQIGFYNTFLNNNVILVTGATGQGKSTQVPKLLYYANKNFLFTQNTRLISTQPRRSPTKLNAERISFEMGVPININNYNSFNNYIQYASSEEKHEFNSSTYIKEVTDRKLYNEISSDIELNNYQIVVIDEAHEHNQNMDMILTLMRHTIKKNKKIKLVITSATMEKDEARYRWYYKNETEYYLNGIFMRVDISPPGESTRFIVNEIWDENDPKNYTESQNKAIPIVEKIANTSTSGDILFFSIGQREITEICNLLNKSLPLNFIALPYYSRLPLLWQTYIRDNKLLENININREYLFMEIEKEGTAPKINYRYTRMVIVATNAAEASLTIDSLKYVVDTGFARSVIYDVFKHASIVLDDKITNSQRIQRKGRVGRVGEGTVYYTYSNKYLNNAEYKYNICTSDFTSGLFGLLKSNENDNLFTMDKLIDKYGTFYLIHPNETGFTRDIDFKPYLVNKLIIPKDENNKRPIPSKKMELYIDDCLNYKLIDKDGLDYYKNSLMSKIYKLYGNFADILPDTELIALSFFRAMVEGLNNNCYNEIIIIIAWYMTCSKPLDMFIHPRFADIFKVYNNDYEALFEIAKIIITSQDFNIDNIIPKKTELDLFILWVRTNKWNKLNIFLNKISKKSGLSNNIIYAKLHKYVIDNKNIADYSFNKEIVVSRSYGLKNDIINTFYSNYMRLAFCAKHINSTNEFVKDDKLIKSFKEIINLNKSDENNKFDEIELTIDINKNLSNIFIKCFPLNIFENKTKCINIIYGYEYIPTTKKFTFLNYVSGYYVYIDIRPDKNSGLQMPLYLIKVELNNVKMINNHIKYISINI